MSSNSRASLLGIPPELRLYIYQAAWPDLLNQRQTGEQAHVTVHGTLCDIPGQASQATYRNGPWALLRTCPASEAEALDWLPAIEDCHFEREDLTYPEISE